MSRSELARLVVLISGNGSNLQALLDACGQGPSRATPTLEARVVAVFSNLATAYGLERARQAGVPAIVFPRPKELDRAQYDTLLAGQVTACTPDWVILAGWMRLLGNGFLSRFPGRVINLHPALPGAFPGTHAIERAYEAFQQGQVDRTGVMVHLVPDEGVDNGPVLAQEVVPFIPHESLADLEDRIHRVEHRLLVSVIRELTSNNQIVNG